VPGIGPRRAEIIVAGTQVFAELLETFGLRDFATLHWGTSSGGRTPRGPRAASGQMLAEQDARATAHREFEHERWESVLATARRYGVDPRHAEPVRAHAVQLFRRAEGAAPVPASTKAGWRPRPSCKTRASLSTTRAITGTRSTSSPAQRSTDTRRCRDVGFAIARYLGKSRPQPGDRRAAQHSPRGAQKRTPGRGAAEAGRGAQPGSRSDVLRVAAKVYPKRSILR